MAGERACGYGLEVTGSARNRAKAATSASAHGQLRGSRSATRRPERTRRPATCSRRWRTRLGSARASSPIQAEQRRPAQQGLRQQRDLQPGLVVGEGGEGHASHPGLLGDADRVLDAGPAAVAQLQGGDVLIALVGDEGGVAVAGLAVEDRELGAGMGTLAADDQPRALGPAREVDAIAQLRDLGALALGAIAVDRALPGRFGQLADRLAHPLVDLVADREADAGRRGSRR